MSELNQKKALIAMSGGVDSSAAAFLMQERGFDCTGVMMKLYESEEGCQSATAGCGLADDVRDAESVAHKLGIPFDVLDFTADFKRQVIDQFCEAYEHGLTPNPCVVCNRLMKFGKLFEHAKQIGADVIATGHYANVESDETPGRVLLKKAADNSKDQSYVLYSLTQEQLRHTLFPLGGLRKADVRKIAEQNGLLNAHKSESQDICFIKNGDYAAFIEQYRQKTFPPGDFVDLCGHVLGRHKGVIHYTVGQRKGLGLSFPAPMYVKSVDTVNNTVTLCEDKDLFTKTFIADHVNWIDRDAPIEPVRLNVKIRYKQKEVPASITPLSPTKVRVDFDTPQRAVTPGQAAVFYNGDIVAGGGTITVNNEQ